MLQVCAASSSITPRTPISAKGARRPSRRNPRMADPELGSPPADARASPASAASTPCPRNRKGIAATETPARANPDHGQVDDQRDVQRGRDRSGARPQQRAGAPPAVEPVHDRAAVAPLYHDAVRVHRRIHHRIQHPQHEECRGQRDPAGSQADRHEQQTVGDARGHRHPPARVAHDQPPGRRSSGSSHPAASPPRPCRGRRSTGRAGP